MILKLNLKLLKNLEKNYKKNSYYKLVRTLFTYNLDLKKIYINEFFSHNSNLKLWI